MCILHYDCLVLGILSKFHMNCKNISQISGVTTLIKIFSTALLYIMFLQKHSQTTLTTKIIKKKKKKKRPKQTLVNG